MSKRKTHIKPFILYMCFFLKNKITFRPLSASSLSQKNSMGTFVLFAAPSHTNMFVLNFIHTLSSSLPQTYDMIPIYYFCRYSIFQLS